MGDGGAGRPAGLGPEPGVDDRHQDAAGHVGQRHPGGVEGVPAERGGRAEEQHHLCERGGGPPPGRVGARPSQTRVVQMNDAARVGHISVGVSVGGISASASDRPDQRDAGNHQHPALSQPGRLAAVEARRSVRDAHDFPLAASRVGACADTRGRCAESVQITPRRTMTPIPHERLSRCLRVRRIGLPPARAAAAVGAEAHPVRRRRAQLHREGLGRRGRALGADVPRRLRGGAAQPGRADPLRGAQRARLDPRRAHLLGLARHGAGDARGRRRRPDPAVHRRLPPAGPGLRPAGRLVRHRARLHQPAHRARPGRHPGPRRRPR